MTTTPRHESLRSLTDDAFEERFGCDRFTATVLANRYRYIVEHMCTGLLTNAFSVILRDWYDFAATISGPAHLDYAMPAASNSLHVFIGTMADAVRNAVEEYGPERLAPGDVLICNDPYRAGTHVNDVCFTRPVFADGQLFGFVNLRAHMLDMGGPVPGGFSSTKRNVYETGVVIAPQLLYCGDEPVRSTWSLIFDNARFGELMLPDVKTIYANLLLGESLLQESVQRYGRTASWGAMAYACDASAGSMALGISGVPDGEYLAEDLIDGDGIDDSEEYRLHVRIVVQGSRMEIDFSGSSRQARTAINAGWLDTKTAVYTALKFLLDPRSPFTSGALRNVDICLPQQAFMHALPPEGAIFLFWESTLPIVLTIFKALRDAPGVRGIAGDFGSLALHNANGVTPDGMPWVVVALTGGEHGPWGATAQGDADSYNVPFMGNNLDPAIEAVEASSPVLILRKEYVADTAGAGRFRGGAAVVKDSLWALEAEHHTMPLHFKTPSGFGVKGGGAGTTGGVWMWEATSLDVANDGYIPALDDDVYQQSTPVAGVLDPETRRPDQEGEYFHFARVPVLRTQPGAVFRYLTNGGGGWGNPFERDPDLVKRDVRDGYVTLAGAERDYGVVITGDPEADPEGLIFDEDATRDRRSGNGESSSASPR